MKAGSGAHRDRTKAALHGGAFRPLTVRPSSVIMTYRIMVMGSLMVVFLFLLGRTMLNSWSVHEVRRRMMVAADRLGARRN